MVTIGKLGKGQETYYLDSVGGGADDYYSGEGEAPGRWTGSGAAELGLEGTVERDQLHAVLSGRDPRTDSPLLRLLRKDRVPGFDVTFSAPKSVSVLWATGDNRTAGLIRDAHERSVEAALGFLEREAAFTRVGTDGHTMDAADVPTTYHLPYQFGKPKSRRSSRSVPMHDRVGAELDLHYQRSGYRGDDDLVFCHPHTGRPLDSSNVLDRLRAALDVAGVRRITFHDLRHTFGTQMAAAGVPMRTLQEWMGHRDIKTTMIYADYAPSDHERALIERAFSRGPARRPGPSEGRRTAAA